MKYMINNLLNHYSVINQDMNLNFKIIEVGY